MHELTARGTGKLSADMATADLSLYGICCSTAHIHHMRNFPLLCVWLMLLVKAGGVGHLQPLTMHTLPCCLHHSPQSNQEMPDVMPSMDFKRIWRSGAAGGGAGDTKHVSIWRPVGPPGYAALGDVAASGTGPPSGRPVKMYKDVLGAGDASGQVGQLGCVAGNGLVPCWLQHRCQVMRCICLPACYGAACAIIVSSCEKASIQSRQQSC